MKPSTGFSVQGCCCKSMSDRGVTYVRFYVDGEDAICGDGSNIGNMSAKDFVDSSEGAVADVSGYN